jgi:hypothetical protein
VLRTIDERIKPEPGTVIEIHAGADYRDWGLVDGLFARGLLVEIPAEGLRSGEQLQFYGRAARSR